jgi:hypothetical protein
MLAPLPANLAQNSTYKCEYILLLLHQTLVPVPQGRATCSKTRCALKNWREFQALPLLPLVAEVRML